MQCPLQHVCTMYEGVKFGRCRHVPRNSRSPTPYPTPDPMTTGRCEAVIWPEDKASGIPRFFAVGDYPSPQIPVKAKAIMSAHKVCHFNIAAELTHFCCRIVNFRFLSIKTSNILATCLHFVKECMIGNVCTTKECVTPQLDHLKFTTHCTLHYLVS